MPTITDISHLLRLESEGILTRIARFYDQDGKITTEYRTIPKPTVEETECLKRSFIYNSGGDIVGEQVKVNVWSTYLDNIVSPPISDIQLSNNSISSGLPAGTKVSDITILGGVFPFQITLSSNPGNLFRIDNGTELVLNAPSSPGSYPIEIEVQDDDDKVESQNFTINVPTFSNVKSVQFDGVDERVDFGTNTDFRFDRLTPFSVSGWIKFGTVLSVQSVFGNMGLSTSPRGWRVNAGVNSQKTIGLHLSASSSNQIVVHSTTAYTDGLWHNFVITYSGSGLASGVTIYVDGAAVAKTVTADSLTNTTVTANNLRAASSADATPSQYFSGSLDELAIWNKELNTSEVTEIYSSGNPSNLSGHSAVANLLHWYRMGDGDTFPTIQDKIGLNNGTCINMEALDIQEDAP